MTSKLTKYLNKIVNVITNDGRSIVGIFEGFDQYINIILKQSHERIYAKDKGVQRKPLGIYIIKGHNVAIIGLINEEKDIALDFTQIKAKPMKPIIH